MQPSWWKWNEEVVMEVGQPTDTLWKSQPRTLLKHQVYRQYLHCWMGKICQKFKSSAIVDAFAGPGAYLDGPDGSPMVIARTFLEHSRRERFGQLRLVCLEMREDRRDYLAGRLAALPQMPRLHMTVLPAGSVRERFRSLYAAAHDGDERMPVLWILDPFDISSAPFGLLRECLRSPRDEVLITWFADELYRFRGDPAKEHAIDTHFGTTVWQQTRRATGEAACKAELLKIYRDSLQSLPGVHTGTFEIASKNETARYALILATHSDSGLDCFNQMKWRMDPYRGRQASEKRVDQPSLFDDDPLISPLRAWLESLAGTAVSFDLLAVQAGRRGFKESHLRAALTGFAEDGLAVREEPLDYTKTPWPSGSRIRFYPLSG
jgi:three-Cys-motif partner protein